MTNNESTAVLNPAPGHSTIADLSVQKTVNQSVVNVGDQVVFTVIVRNNGPDDSANIDINDLLPAGVSYVSSTASQGAYTPGTGVWSAGLITVNAYALLDIVANVNSIGVHTNVATVGLKQCV